MSADFYVRWHRLFLIVHGAVRLIERGFTPEEISDIKLLPDKIMSQADGASVFIKSISDGKYSVIVEGENGVVTALRNISEKSLNRLANNYGWEWYDEKS